ncbi:hypothetical protein FHS26_006679 [Rhizobium pisi]|uniref:Uncharacterized protein n=1 Tax=Rhizobium pisi TaxID=574561 RepID=A0A7W5BTL2_9HYPH|nr:hypothetical protein [Rhizobium pisi]
MREIIQTRSRPQLLRLAALLLVIVLGLALRRFGYAVDLPFIVVKYGGSALWGAMVYLLLALFLADCGRRQLLSRRCAWPFQSNYSGSITRPGSTRFG